MSYHFKNSRTSVNKDEPVYLTRFLLTVVLPPALRPKYGTQVISEQLKKIGGLTLDKLPDTVEQMYRFHKRRFAGSVVETNIDLDMSFEVNVDENKIMYPYNIFHDWSKLIYDPNTGNMTLKRDYVGSCTIEIHDRAGFVLRNVYFPIIFPITPPNPFDLEYGSESIYTLDITFAGENQTDLIVGSGDQTGGATI